MEHNRATGAHDAAGEPEIRDRPVLVVVRAEAFPEEVLEPLRERFHLVEAGTPEAEEVAPVAVLTPPDPGAVLNGRRATDRAGVSLGARAVLDAIGEGACLCSPEGDLVWKNEHFDAFEPEIRERIVQSCHEAAQRFVTALRDTPQGETLRSLPTRKFYIQSADNGRHFEVIVSAVLEAGSDPAGPELKRVAAVIFDETGLRRTQQKIDAIDQAAAELVKIEPEQVRRMHVIQRLELLRGRIVQLAHDLLQFDHFAIWLVDPNTKRLELVMSTGLSAEVQNIDLYASRDDNGISGYVAATGRSYICHDVTQDKRYIKGMDTPGSSLTLPLLLNDKVIGVFNVESTKIGGFTEDDRQFAEIFARYVALALHMLNLLVAERAATSETLSNRMEGSLAEPLNDLMVEAEWLQEQAALTDPAVAEHVQRIIKDVQAIRERVKQAASGPRTILGADKELEQRHTDPVVYGKRVLVADDEANIRELVREVMENRGAEVVVCEGGSDAIARLEYAADAGQRFDLIISDIRMPDRNGYEIYAAARVTQPGLPVILMTGFGYDPHHSIVRASQEGLQGVLFKPFQCEALIEEVHKALSPEAPK